MNSVYLFKFPLEGHTLGGADFYAAKLTKHFVEQGREIKLFTSDKKIFRLFERHALPRKRTFAGWEPTSKKALLLWPLTYFIAHGQFRKILHAVNPRGVFLLHGLTEKLILTPLLLNDRRHSGGKIIWLEHKIPGRWLKKNPLRFRYLKLARQVQIVTVSEFARGEFLKFGIKAENIQKLYPSANLTFNQPQTTPLNAHGEYPIGILGRLDPEKGILDFLEAISMQLKKTPHWRILIAGDGSEKKGIEEFVRKTGLQKQVQILGFINNLGDFFRKISVLAYPSVTPESFGLSAAHAMNQGLPVVATDIGALPEIIGEEHAALLVPPNNPAKWATALEELTDERKYQEISAHLRTRSENFSDVRFFSSFLQLLQNR